MAWVLGVDGCRGGWLGARVFSDGRLEWVMLADAAAIVAVGAPVTAVDMPIGLADHGPRECDLAARRLLGPRHACVYPAPARPVLAALTYAEACEISRTVSGTAISRQAWNIIPRIADLDRVISPWLQRRIVETHPEVSFTLMAGAPLPPKRTTAGRARRITVLRGWLGDVTPWLRLLPRPARPDDGLDALAAAWSAFRLLRAEARILPHDDPPRDACGLRMEIVA